ncbi:MAG: DUF2313 domain-containing protein [Eubacteriales bacterium]|jgi:uncharacterized protein YmfQ (DUF2313 family)
MKLIDLLPPLYVGNATMQELQAILTNKINSVLSATNATVDECFVTTASALLSRYEKIYGIAMDVSKSDDMRREILKAKIAGIGTVTKQMLIDTAASYSNGTVEIIEHPETYSFIVKFTGTLGIPQNIAGLTKTINEIKPAHLAFSFEYTYRTHGMLTGYTHAQLAAYTHETIRGGTM